MQDGPTSVREMRKIGFTGKIFGVTGNGLKDQIEFFMFDFSKKPKKNQPPHETIESLRTFTLEGLPGEIVPVDKYIVLHAEYRTIYTDAAYEYKLYEWRLYKSPNVSWIHTPDAGLVLYVNDSPSDETTVGLGPAKKKKKYLNIGM